MATDSITNFISATTTVLTWVSGRVNTVSGLANACEIYESQNEQQIFDWAHKVTRNQAIVKYVRSKYNRDGNARRVMVVDVYLVYRHTTNRVAGQTAAVNLMDATIAAIDHEGSADFMAYVIADASVDFPDAGLSVYMCEFEIEDY